MACIEACIEEMNVSAVRLLMLMNEFDVRSQAKDVPLGETRKAGRPLGT
jgi:hypothetical protein